MHLIQALEEALDENQSGAKAKSLSRMQRMGYPVPPGFVLNNNAQEAYGAHIDMSPELQHALQEALNKLPAGGCMVRSSAIGEDSAESSFAGQLDSFCCSTAVQDVWQHIRKCWDSRNKANVKSYENAGGVQLRGMGVVVQALIEPDFAGVAFSRHPDNENRMLIEYVQGHGEQLVSGAVVPQSVSTDLDGSHVPDWLRALVQDVRRLELQYGHPLDVEWAIRNKQHYLLQARPITTAAKSRRIYWSNTNVNENYPEAISPLLYSIARDAYYHYFKNLSVLFKVPANKIRALESAYCNVIGVFGARMYYNMSSIHAIMAASPFSETLMQSFDNFVGYAEGQQAEQAGKQGSKSGFARRLLQHQFSLGKQVRLFEQEADAYSLQAEQAISFEELQKAFHGFVEIRMHGWYRASLADFFAMVYHGLLGKFCKRFYGAESDGMHNKLIQAIPGLISSKPILSLYAIKSQVRNRPELHRFFSASSPQDFLAFLDTNTDYNDVKEQIETHIRNWGFRSSGELMLTHKTYIEEPCKFIELLQQYDRLPESNPEALIQEKYRERLQCISAFRAHILKKRGINLPLALAEIAVLNLLIRMASSGIAYRERVRLKQALLYFRFKQVLQKTGLEFRKRKLIGEAEDIRMLRHQEIAELFCASDLLHAELKARIESRRRAFDHVSQQVFPDDFSSHAGQTPDPRNLVRNQTAEAAGAGLLTGMPVCGGVVKARARVLESVMEAQKLEKGDILVTRQTDPGWVLVFPLISGLIVERGGMLSHGAIVSREFGIPAIVGVHNACGLIKDGDLIVLNAENGQIQIGDV